MRVMRASSQSTESKPLQLPAADESMGTSASGTGKENQLSAMASKSAAAKPPLPNKAQQRRKVKGVTANSLQGVNKLEPVEGVHRSSLGRKLKPTQKANV